MVDYADKTGWPRIEDTNENWGALGRAVTDYMSNIVTPDDCYFVSPGHTPTNLGNGSATNRRHFPTLQEAIDAAQVTTGYSSRRVVFADPAAYGENIVISGSIKLVCQAGAPAYAALGSGYGGEIVGAAGSQAPTIKISPPDGVTISVGIHGFNIRNLYNAAATAIEKGMLIEIEEQTTVGPYHNRLFLSDCGLKGQGYGEGNDWLAMVLAKGRNLILGQNCDFSAIAYAGGLYNGGCRSLFDVRGNAATGATAILKVRRSDFRHLYNGAEVVTPQLVYGDHNATGWVAMSSLDYPVSGGTQHKAGAGVAYGANGTNAIAGLTSGELAEFGNLYGQNLSFVG